MIATAFAHLRAQWMGALALFLVIAGGTAYAADTIFSADIVNGEVKTPDLGATSVTVSKLAGDAVTASKIADGSVRGADVLDDSLNAADLAGVSLLRSKTSRLTAAGGGTGEAMFQIGRVGLTSFCSKHSGTLTAGIEPVVDEQGPLLVIGDSTIRLQPLDVQFVTIVSGDTAIAGQESSFAILDQGGTSASGVAAASVDPATGKCVVTAEAVG